MDEPEPVVPFRVDIAEADLEDLRERLRETRWPVELMDNANWQAGANLACMRELVAYWLDSYDWRAQEQAINGFANFKTRIDGVPIHFIHERGKGPNPMPLVVNHGWPWSFWDMQKIIRPLTDPASFGGDPADAFDVVAPSLPGFAFSEPLDDPDMNAFAVADLWVKLMARLGYDRFAAEGGDIGGAVVSQLGHKYPERLFGAHLHFIMPSKAPFPTLADYGPEEEHWKPKNATLEKNWEFMRDGAAYMNIQRTRPQTIAYAMHDSPVGLAAWLIEKRRYWSDSRDGLESAFSKDDLITGVMLYWLTETYITTARYYHNRGSGHVHDRTPVVEAPTAVIQFEGDVTLRPRRWAARYFNVQRWNVVPRGGHFAPMESPERLVEDLREFFRPMRAAP